MNNINKLFIFFAIILMAAHWVNGQDEFNVIKDNWLQYSDAPNSLYHYLSDQAIDLLAARAENVAKLNTLADWQQRQNYIHKTLTEIVGPFPEKTALNPKITRVIEKESYRIEHIIFESQPGFYVTSSMFIPKGLPKKSKAPAIIFCSGHTEEGYRSAVYQYAIINFVKKGFIVFAFDPIGQGERLEYLDPKTGKSSVGGPTSEHSYSGNQAFICGSSQARYMIWDGIRAVDYLLTRKEVDPARIGITGRSGGGTQSAYIAAFDERIYACAPENYITNFTRLFQSIGPQDAEQNFPSGIASGLDHSDLLLVRAPKPALMITTTRDFFSIQGARETEKEVARIYKAYGKENNFKRTEDDTTHASTRKNREATCAFFQEQLKNPGNPQDEEVTLLTPEELRVTTTGQVSTSLGGETVFSLNRKEAEQLVGKLTASRSSKEDQLKKAVNSARNLSGYREPSENDHPVFTGRYQYNGYVIEKYFIRGEGDYVVPYLLWIPARSNNKAVICLHPEGKAAEVSPNGDAVWLVSKGFTVLAPDLIGIGETGPGIFRGDAYIEGESHNLWYASILIGRSIVGIRAGDAVKLARMLLKDHTVNEVYGIARKEMAPVLLHAAAFEKKITRVALIEPYSSYETIALNRFYISSFISGAVCRSIKEYDLPDLAASLAPGKLFICGVTDGNRQTTDSVIEKDLSVIKMAFRNKNAEDQLKIMTLQPGVKMDVLLNEWIK